MTNLILKDYIFTRKQRAYRNDVLFAVPILLVMDGGDKNYWHNFSFRLPSHLSFLQKYFYMEDATDVRYFLKLLPYSVYKRVGSRFCFMGITLIFARGYIYGLLQCIVFNQQTVGCDKKEMQYQLLSSYLFCFIYNACILLWLFNGTKTLFISAW